MSRLEEVLQLLEGFDLPPEARGGLPFPDEEGKTVGQLAIRWLNKGGYLKLATRKPGAPRVLVEVLQDGKPLMVCKGITEASRKTGYHHTTIYRYAMMDKTTADGVGFRILGKEKAT
jgi:hypothetical protein